MYPLTLHIDNDAASPAEALGVTPLGCAGHLALAAGFRALIAAVASEHVHAAPGSAPEFQLNRLAVGVGYADGKVWGIQKLGVGELGIWGIGELGSWGVGELWEFSRGSRNVSSRCRRFGAVAEINDQERVFFIRIDSKLSVDFIRH